MLAGELQYEFEILTFFFEMKPERVIFVSSQYHQNAVSDKDFRDRNFHPMPPIDLTVAMESACWDLEFLVGGLILSCSQAARLCTYVLINWAHQFSPGDQDILFNMSCYLPLCTLI